MLIPAITGYGTNTGIRAVAAGGGHGHAEGEIRYVRRCYFTRGTAQAVATGHTNSQRDRAPARKRIPCGISATTGRSAWSVRGTVPLPAANGDGEYPA